MTALTHLDDAGAARMVDISNKTITTRKATAQGHISMSPEALAAIEKGSAKKGDVLAVARIAAIMAAKKTSDLIPLCHAVALSSVTIEFQQESGRIIARATACTTAATGVEMEAITAVSIALLTIYDMAKAIDRGMIISEIRVMAKAGGRSGDWRA